MDQDQDQDWGMNFLRAFGWFVLGFVACAMLVIALH